MPNCPECGQSMPVEGFCPGCGDLVIGGAGQRQQARPAATAPRRAARNHFKMGYIGWLLVAAIIGVVVSTVTIGRKRNYTYIDKADYGTPSGKGLKVWVYAQDMSRGEAIAKHVVESYGRGYDEVTTLLHPPKDTSDLYIPKEMAQHSYTWTRDGGIKQDF